MATSAQVAVIPGASFSQHRGTVCVPHMLPHTLSFVLPVRSYRRQPFSSRPFSPSRQSIVPLASFASLGFSADPRISIERAANNLLKDAASLLLYQEVLRVPAAQAFLKVLLGLRRGDEGWKLLDAYGEFYKLMAAGQFLSWEDLILEGILIGEENPFAEALANVGNPKSQWSRGAPPSLQAAAAADLDSLQRLSVTECTLVGWVTDLIPDIRPEWKVAAESTLSSRNVKKVSSSSGNEKSSWDSNVFKSDGSLLHLDPTAFSSKEASLTNSFGNGALASNRETWRRKIGGLWRWSEAVPLLEDYYAQHGIGKTACEQALLCKGGKLLKDASFCALKGICNLSIHKEHSEKLFTQFEQHAARSGSRLHSGSSRILVHGPSGSGRTYLVKSALHGFVKQEKLRVVQMLKSEMKHLQSILDDLEKRWQLRFVLVVDSLSLTDELMFPNSWPENVMFCGIGLSSAPHKISDELRDMFGTIVTLEDLNLQSYLLSVEQMLDQYNKELGLRPLGGVQENYMDQATSWAKDRSVLTVRTAAQFVRSIM